ncbi:MAG: 3-alpha,7-alpha,12-alpha-trihydroxy-5-beta-cholest-24-enoyl-CoA hydratase [Gammaproteobacteria bacterium]|nr:3-alpha,7-alpha,12-alpha-trihydroxy-5-beta-cholest-24-enoyl-CoA hydratase [Gammaproteobacteria bacterium]
MPTRYQQLLALQIPEKTVHYSAKDCQLYALSLGLGSNPLDPTELAFVYEKDLQVLPSLSMTLAHPGFWARDLDSGLDWVKILHAGQSMTMHETLPSEAHIVARSRIVDVIDKGEGKGVLVYFERQLIDRDSGVLYCTMVQTVFCRGDGGMGGNTQLQPQLHAIPARNPSAAIVHHTAPQMALLYRLNGDMNPLHADPEIARKAGFERPILQGLASFGVACASLIRLCCDNDPARMGSMDCRFSAPVYPGESLRTEVWQEEAGVYFRVTVVGREVRAIDNGFMAYS